jgi:ribonuclease-3
MSVEGVENLIGYSFRNRALLDEALTHASFLNQKRSDLRSNQRLEFLGDAVLQLVLSAKLYHLLPETAGEGLLSQSRSRLVSTASLAEKARALRLGEFLHMQKGAEASGGRERESILADAMEAVIGAVYLDAGMEVCEQWLNNLFADSLKELKRAPGEVNPKGQLQEKLQSIDHQVPTYQVVQTSGPAHRRVYEVEVHWGGRLLARGSGSSKKEAEAAAATLALETKLRKSEENACIQ